MCLAIPGKLVETYREHDVRMGKVDFGGIFKRVCLEHVPEAEIDDYVLVHVGFALSRIDEAEAMRVFEFLSTMDQLDELKSEPDNGTKIGRTADWHMAATAKRCDDREAVMKYLTNIATRAAETRPPSPAPSRGHGRSWKSAAARRTRSSSTGSTRSCRRRSSWSTGRAARSA